MNETVRTSKEAVRQRLTTSYDRASGTRILFEGVSIGKLVTFGSRTRPGKTVYASRIYGDHKIEAEASTQSALLEKVAVELSRSLKASGRDTLVAIPEQADDEVEDMGGLRP